jgi:TctA family transporter
MILGFILGPMMEENLRRALLMAKGDWTVFVTRPISGSLLLVSALLVAAIAVPAFAKTREQLKDD